MYKFNFHKNECALDVNNSILKFNQKSIALNNSPIEKSNRIYLKISNLCNLNCIYCFQKNDFKNNFPIDLKQYAKIFHDCILPRDSNTEIIIFGGEPFLDSNKNNLTYLFEKIADNKFNIFTNGCFSENILNLIIENKVKIKNLIISLDGPESIHDLRRVSGEFSSYRKILSNAIILRNHDISFEFQINVDKSNINYIYELFLDLDSILGLCNISTNLNRVLRSNDSISEIDLLILYKNISEKFPDIPIGVNSVVFNKLSTFISNHGIDRPRCRIGFKDKVYDFTNNTIYSCPQSTNTIIGHFNQDTIFLDTKRQEEMFEFSNKNNDICNKCDHVNFCSYGCFLDKNPIDHTCIGNIQNQISYIINNFSTFFELKE